MSRITHDPEVHIYTIPTDGPESDGTLEWNETTMILVLLTCDGIEGLGYAYGNRAIRQVILSELSSVVKGRDPMDVMAIQAAMVEKIRNDGQSGLAMMAVSAVDMALWDLKAKLLKMPLCRLLGQVREGIGLYGSGGFTSYSNDRLCAQLEGWVSDGFGAVKIKVGRNLSEDAARVAVAREAIGQGRSLYVDANGAYTVSQAVDQARVFAGFGVDWLEEPVPAVHVDQITSIHDRLPAGMRLVAGEYGYTLNDLLLLLRSGAVDVVQADATRCGGITGFLKAGYLCEAFRVPLSSHCAPAAHLHAAVALPAFSIAEYFYDHVRIEERFFSGPGEVRQGQYFPDLSKPGLGIVFLKDEAAAFRVA